MKSRYFPSLPFLAIILLLTGNLSAQSSSPVITSALNAMGNNGVNFCYQIAAITTSPTGYNASGLPAGLSVNTTTGLISGTPTATGTSNVTISASYAGDTITAPVVLSNSLDIANASGNTLTLSGTITNLSASAVTIANQGAGSGGVVISGVILNSGAPISVRQNSASSALTLSGTNTYSGATTVSAGTLIAVAGGSCTNSAVVVAATAGNPATLNISVPDMTKQWRCKSLTVNNAGVASVLNFDFAGALPSTTMAPLKVAGMATFTTTPIIRVSRYIPVGTYPLMTWTNNVAANVPPAVTAPSAYGYSVRIQSGNGVS